MTNNSTCSSFAHDFLKSLQFLEMKTKKNQFISIKFNMICEVSAKHGKH